MVDYAGNDPAGIFSEMILLEMQLEILSIALQWKLNSYHNHHILIIQSIIMDDPYPYHHHHPLHAIVGSANYFIAS